MQQPRYSVVMPAYNEGDTVFGNLAITVEELSSLSADYEVILVDDSSTDNTKFEAERASKAFPNIRVLSYHPNRGKGHAVLTGLQAARGELISFLDADLDLHPSQLCAAFRLQHEKSADVVIGSKWHPDSVVKFPLFRRIVSFCFYMTVRILFGLPIRDTQTGLKVYRRAVLQQLLPLVSTNGFGFDVEMLVLAHKMGCTIAEMPVVVRTTRRNSRIKIRDIILVAIETFRVFFRVRGRVALPVTVARKEGVSTAEVRRS